MTNRPAIVTVVKLKTICSFLLILWFQFVISQHKIINSGWQYSEDKKTWQTVNIPHTWNKEDAFDDTPGYRRGFGFYKKQVFIASEERTKIQYLKFNGVNQEATVYINGKEIGSHKGGYTAFNFNISKDIHYGAYNLIEVTADNSHNKDIPPLDADFTFYGGIYRDVELISLPKQHFSLNDFASDGFYINYYKVSPEKAGIQVTSILNNRASINLKTKFRLDLFDAEGNLVKTRTKTLKLLAETSNEFKIKLPEIYGPKLWSPKTPYLYRLKLVLMDKNERVLESKWANVGFRWVSVDSEKGFFLNGKPIKLIGVNLHQDYKGHGNAVPVSLQKKDIHLIKNMGANVIRFAHYPHARALYDLCDELGILVWTEIPVVNKVTNSKAFFDTCINMQKEHVKQYYNHPSVVMLGYMNEVFLRLAFDNKASKEERKNLKATTTKLANQLENLTRKLAPNRITVMAGHLNNVYNETGIADLPMLFGWNLYFGWYDKDIQDLGIFLDEQHKKYPNRSLLLSEYGSGADVRIYTKTPKKFDFSTDYQAKLHQSYYKQITDRPFMSGMIAWNFTDFGSEFRGDAIPHVNQKGLMQYDRTPKEIYYWYKSALNKDQPFLHIATDFLKGLTLFENEKYPVDIYSNQSEATVFLNGKTFKTIQFKNGTTTIEMPFKNGQNIIKVISGDVSKEKTIDALKLNAIDFKDFNRFGINIGSHFFFNDEERNLTFVPDQPYKKGWFGYVEGIAFGMTKFKNQGIPYNIKNSTLEPLFQTMLEGCKTYKVDVPNGTYKVDLFFVEPQIKPTKNIYNLSEAKDNPKKNLRIFDVYINTVLVEKNFDLANSFPEKYGVTLTSNVNVENNENITISLKPQKGQPIISGILIEKLR